MSKETDEYRDSIVPGQGQQHVFLSHILHILQQWSVGVVHYQAAVLKKDYINNKLSNHTSNRAKYSLQSNSKDTKLSPLTINSRR